MRVHNIDVVPQFYVVLFTKYIKLIIRILYIAIHYNHDMIEKSVATYRTFSYHVILI